ncbi:MAG: efflux RND transporter periplasmic adaptor subunit [Pseudomonadota bacterium]
MRIKAIGAWLVLLMMVLSEPSVAQQGPASVTTDLVSTREVAETVAVFGQVVAGRQSDVATRVVGVVEGSLFRVGDTVEAGEVIFRIDTERLQIELQQAAAELSIAEAGVVVAQARLDRTEKALERTQTLVENATVSQAQLDDRSGEYAEALGSLQQAQARIAAAKAGMRVAEYNAENAVISAPFDGTILEVASEVGEFVSAGSVVIRLLDNGALEVEANVPSRFISALQPDQNVIARTDGGQELTTVLRAILPTEFSETRTRPVRFALTEARSDIAVGQSVTLDVPVSRPEDVTVVPKDAVNQSAGGWQVFVNEAGTAVPRRIEIGRAIGNAFEVLSGLAVGDEVVVRGNERLRPGQEIAPTPLNAEGGENAAAGAPPRDATNGG